MQDFKKLNVWQKAHILAVAIYKATMSFPKDELYGLTSQMRRSASSIPANPPGYVVGPATPVPELPAGLLFGMGLLGIGVYLAVKKYRKAATAK